MLELETIPTFLVLSILQQYQKSNWFLSPFAKFCTMNKFRP